MALVVNHHDSMSHCDSQCQWSYTKLPLFSLYYLDPVTASYDLAPITLASPFVGH